MAANTKFNLNALGTCPTEYVDDMHGDTGSTLHGGLDTDRLIVKWQLDDPDVERRIAGERSVAFPDTGTEALVVLPLGPTNSGVTNRSLPTGVWVRIAVPSDIVSLKATDPVEARRWQRSVREAFRIYLKAGYRVVDFCEGREAAPPTYALTTEPMSGPDS